LSSEDTSRIRESLPIIEERVTRVSPRARKSLASSGEKGASGSLGYTHPGGASIAFDEGVQEIEALGVRVPERIEQPDSHGGFSIPGAHDFLNAPDAFSPPVLVPGEPDDEVKRLAASFKGLPLIALDGARGALALERLTRASGRPQRLADDSPAVGRLPQGCHVPRGLRLGQTARDVPCRPRVGGRPSLAWAPIRLYLFSLRVVIPA